jgi:hypothetical protein
MDHWQTPICRTVDVAFDDVNAQRDRRSEGGQRVLRELVRVTPVPAEQNPSAVKPLAQTLGRRASILLDLGLMLFVDGRPMLHGSSRTFYIRP